MLLQNVFHHFCFICIRIPLEKKKPGDSISIYVIGYGSMGKARAANVALESGKESGCKAKFPKSGFNDKQHICARKDGVNVCDGDRGGALVELAVKHQIGIVSRSLGCPATEYRVIYTNVSSFREWIAKKVAPEKLES